MQSQIDATYGVISHRLTVTGWIYPTPDRASLVVDGRELQPTFAFEPRPIISKRQALKGDPDIWFTVQICLARPPTGPVVVVAYDAGNIQHLIPLSIGYDAEFMMAARITGDLNSIAGEPKTFLCSAVNVSGHGNAISVGPDVELENFSLNVVGDRNELRFERGSKVSGVLNVFSSGCSLKVPAGAAAYLTRPLTITKHGKSATIGATSSFKHSRWFRFLSRHEP